MTVGLVHDLNMQSRGSASLGPEEKKSTDAYGMYLSSVAKYGHATLVSDLHHERSSEREKRSCSLLGYYAAKKWGALHTTLLALSSLTYHVHGDL